MTPLSNKDVLLQIGSNPIILDFIMKLKPDELESFREFIMWSANLLVTQHLKVLHRMWDIVQDRDEFIKTYFLLTDHPNSSSINLFDAFSQGQIDSKNWLISTTIELKIPLNQVWILCGWIGVLPYLMNLNMDKLKISKIRSFDIDPMCAELAEILNKKLLQANWSFKSFTMDVNNLNYDEFQWTFWSKVNNRMSYPILESADTIINTSCDHMGKNNSWWNSIPSGKLVILQNNNFTDVNEHNNVVNSLREFIEMYPMNELLFSGSLDCKLYTRYMLIGRK
jgi:hypothetical protein